jgi:hypothetical protein
MHQALHIFKKDLRYLRYEATLVVLFAAIFAVMHLRTTHSAFAGLVVPEIFWFVGVASLVGRLVLAEAIPGDRQFWITRPYRWRSLLGAKVLFLIAFVNLPILAAQFLIMLIDGFPLAARIPGLLWSQLLLFAFLLPVVAFATLSTAKPYQLILFGLAAAVWELTASGNAAGPLSGVAWISQSVALIVICAIAISILLLQYRSRRTLFSRCLALGGIVAAVLIFVATPWRVALAVESHLAKPGTLGSSVEVGLGHGLEERFWAPQMKPKVLLHLPISVQGIPVGTEVQPDALSISFQGSDGRLTQLSAAGCWNLKRGSISESAATIFAL